MSYTYKGISCLKNPFDLAIYPLLLTKVKPQTIIEIGSAAGGSALWLSDITKSLGLATEIISVDIEPVKDVSPERVRFIYGDIYNLAESELPMILQNCKRPLLVIEDGPHSYEGCQSALSFFHPYMKPDDFIIIEDGIVRDLGYRSYRNGPNRAIAEHVTAHSDTCEIDREYCDYFGQNFTWATNGYIHYTSK